MAHDERNFRSAYYEKVGFRAVEEKKSLEILLKDKPLDKVKLKQFSLRFSVPASYRNLVWKILLGVLPIYCDSHAFIMSERRQEYAELLRALQVMKVIDNQTPKAQVFHAMWMLQTGNLRFNVNLSSEDGLVSIIQAFMQFFDDDSDVYLLTKCFYDQKLKNDIEYPKLKEMAWISLQKHNNTLYNHLLKTDILHNLPVDKWFDCCFAGVLSETALGKIWDKLCGGNFKILAFVVVNLLSNQGHNLEKCKDLKSALNYLLNVPEDAAEKIANESISMWQGQQDKPKS